MITAMQIQKLQEYGDLCARINDCSKCPLYYDPPQFPPCEYMALVKKAREAKE